MAVFRKHKKDNFTTIDNGVFKNRNISYKATGLLCTMLSLPDNWEFTLEGLATLKKEKISAVRTAILELEENGYLKRTRARNSKGVLETMIYDIYETPTLDFPILEKPMLENPTLENQTQLNTNIIKDLNNKELINKKRNIKENVDTIDSVPYEDIIIYLNHKTGNNYRSTTPKTKQLIKARINEGFTPDDFKAVIDNMTSEWINDNKMKNYLRPETLFGTKFESYLNRKQKKTSLGDITNNKEYMKKVMEDFFNEN